MTSTTQPSAHPLVSVVIGFKDWGLERLELSVESIHASLGEIPHEVVISDYGSEDPHSIAEAAARIGARHEIADTDGEWSRSRALNAGVRASTGEIILATDADMLFTPRALSRVVEQLERHPQEIVILQCRDLPVGFSHDVVRRDGFDWERFASIGQIRPRWGMGGLVGVRREIWERLRGWDERMHTYGGEDIDFGKRAQAFGARIDWLDEPGVGMYHIWHPSSGASAARSAAATAAIAENRRIHSTDRTFARNRDQRRYLPADILPLVTVIIDATSAAPATLRSTITSVLGQTVRDIEVLVVGEAEVPADPRVRSVPAASLDFRGTFVTAAKPGHIWTEDRLAELLALWEPGVGLLSDRAAFLLRGDDGAPLAPLAAAPGTAPDPYATVLRSALLAGQPADLVLPWREAVIHVASAGAIWVNAPLSLHVAVSDLESDEPSASVRAQDAQLITTALARCGLAVPEVPEATIRPLGALADALVHGSELVLEVEAPVAIDLGPVADLLDGPNWRRRTIRTASGSLLERSLQWYGDDAAYAAEAAYRIAQTGAAVRLRRATSEDAADDADLDASSLARTAEAVHGTPGSPSAWLAISRDADASTEVHELLTRTPSVTVVLDRVVERQGESAAWLLARFRSGAIGEALTLAASMPTTAQVDVIELPAELEGTEISR